jgi:hypothetical protein
MTDAPEPHEYELRVWRNEKHVITENFATFDELSARMGSLLLLYDDQPAEYRMQGYQGDGFLVEITNR